MAIKLFSESSALPGIYRNILAYDLSLIRNQCSRDQSYKKPPRLVELSKCAWHGAQCQRANASSFPQESLVRYWVSRLLPPEPVSVPLPLRCPGLLPLTHALPGAGKGHGARTSLSAWEVKLAKFPQTNPPDFSPAYF